MFQRFGFLSALLLSASLHLALIGCSKAKGEPEVPRPQVTLVESQPGCSLKVSSLGNNDFGYWRLVELTYNDQKHVYLQHFDSNNQSMIEVTAK